MFMGEIILDREGPNSSSFNPGLMGALWLLLAYRTRGVWIMTQGLWRPEDLPGVGVVAPST